MKPLDLIACSGVLPESFFAIPARVYADQPHRPPEDAGAVARLFADEAPRHDLLLCTDHERLRLVGMFPHDDPETAFFGFWETTDDPALNQAAFARLAQEAQRRGRRRLRGPLQFNTYQPYRLRLGEPPSWGHFDREPVNPAYYPTLLTGLGFAAVQHFESRLIRPDAIPRLFDEKTALLAALADLPFDFIPLDAATWQAHEAALFDLVHQIFSANPAYRGISAAQFRRLYNPTYADGLCPHTSVLLRDRATGALAALSLCHPNYAPLNLREPPRFSRDFPRLPVKTLLAKTVGVHPGFRQRGLMNALGAYGMVHFRERYEQVIFCLMRANNPSLRFTDGLPVEMARYALFETSFS